MSHESEVLEEIRKFKEKFESFSTSLENRIKSIEIAGTYLKILEKVDLPGVKTRLENLLRLFEHLKDGDVVMEWRSEVYQHDIELIKNLRPMERLRATVPILDDDSFDDADFVDYIRAQAHAAERGVIIEKAYLFSSLKQKEEKLSRGPLLMHLESFKKKSRNIRLYTVISKRHLDDFVIFGDSRCSVSRGAIDAKHYQQFKVLYTSKSEELGKCNREWDNLEKEPFEFTNR